MLDAQLAIANKNVLLNDSTLRIIQLQYEAGQVTLLAVQQATAQRLVAVQLIPFLQQKYFLAGKCIKRINRLIARQHSAYQVNQQYCVHR
jgi:outer membrane protein TolC